MAAFHTASVEDKLLRLFDVLDIDEDGLLTGDDIRCVFGPEGHRFRHLDTALPPALTRAEFVRLSTTLFTPDDLRDLLAL